MAFSSRRNTSDRSEEYPLRSPQSPLDGPMSGNASAAGSSSGVGGGGASININTRSTGFSSLISPPRSAQAAAFGSAHTSPPNGEARGGLPRRFTTNAVPTMPNFSVGSGPLSPLAQQRRQAAEQTDMATVLEKKKAEFEKLREVKKRFEAEMEILDNQTEDNEKELHRLSSEISSSLPGNQSEPTTPPDFDSHGFPHSLSNPNRLSASLMSPPGLITGLGSASKRNSVQAAGATHGYHGHSQSISYLPSKSMPGSRRGSDEEASALEMELAFAENTSGSGNSMSNAGFSANRSGEATPSSYLQMNRTPTGFPTLNVIRRGADDQADDSGNTNGWGVSRHRAVMSLPMNTLGAADDDGLFKTPPRARVGHSREGSFSDNQGDQIQTPASMPRLQSSYSANDVPTVGGANAAGGALAQGTATPNTHAEKHFHRHNASMGRIPAGASSKRHSREVSGPDSLALVHTRQPSISSPTPATTRRALQGNATPFGPLDPDNTTSPSNSTAVVTSGANMHNNMPHPWGANPQFHVAGSANFNNVQYPVHPNWAVQGGHNGQYPQGGHNGNYSQAGHNGQYPQYGQTGQYGQGGQYGHAGQAAYQQGYNSYHAPGFGQGRGPAGGQYRRPQNGEDGASKFANASVEDFKGQLYALARDQHGCRFLQKKLDERDPAVVNLVFAETSGHIIDLMIDPFGNYLCQKLLEHCNEKQRTTLINNAAHDMVKIALNQHGTRALQKMIDYINTPEQVATITRALRGSVVRLIKDLNGNHVIQKCLNHLKSEDASFIIEAVGRDCVVVGTHRHGCCVIQRCVDHASDVQKPYLVGQITENAFQLVQDAFGNYVVQYILDLGQPEFADPLCAAFQGHMSELAQEKFSSNVVEKVIRCANPQMKAALINELIVPYELDLLLRDSFGNYVIQTAMEYADPATYQRLTDAIRPLFSQIRSTPYGRRIVNKINDRDERNNGRRGGSGHRNGGGPSRKTPVATAASPATQSITGTIPQNVGGPATQTMAGTAPHNMGGPVTQTLAGPTMQPVGGPSAQAMMDPMTNSMGALGLNGNGGGPGGYPHQMNAQGFPQHQAQGYMQNQAFGFPNHNNHMPNVRQARAPMSGPPQGYGPQAYGHPQAYNQPQGYGQPQGNGQPHGNGQPQDQGRRHNDQNGQGQPGPQENTS